MFKEMRRKEKQMELEAVVKALTASEYGTLATVGADGYPYSVPLNYVYEDNAIYFHSALTGQKVDNMLFNNKVSFSVVAMSKVLPEKFSAAFISVVVYGKVKEISDNEEKNEALIKLIKKYSPNYIEKGIKYIEEEKDVLVFKIEIEHIMGKQA